MQQVLIVCLICPQHHDSLRLRLADAKVSADDLHYHRNRDDVENDNMGAAPFAGSAIPW